MYRLTQKARNSFLRLQGWLEQFGRFLKNNSGRLQQMFSYLAELLGLTTEPYFPETDNSQQSKSTSAQSQSDTLVTQAPLSTASATRRRPDAKMKDFLQMAQQSKAPKARTTRNVK